MNGQSFAARARRRNNAIARRNQRIRDALPLFDAAGILDQVATLDARRWDALAVAYDEIARGIETYVYWTERERRHRARHAMYCQMLAEAIGTENVEEVLADYAERWRGHAAMQQWEYRLDYVCRYLATYSRRPPLEVAEECTRRLTAGDAATP